MRSRNSPFSGLITEAGAKQAAARAATITISGTQACKKDAQGNLSSTSIFPWVAGARESSTSYGLSRKDRKKQSRLDCDSYTMSTEA